MQRSLVVIAMGLVLFVAATLGGFVWSARHAPGWARAELERQLALAVDAPVRLDRVRLGLRGGIRLVADGASLGPTEGGTHLEAGQIEGWLDPLALVTGRLVLDRFVARDADVSVPTPPPDSPPVLETFETLAQALAAGPVRRVVLEETSLWAEGPDGSRELLLAGIAGDATRSRMRPEGRFAFEARIGSGRAGIRLEGRAAPGTTRMVVDLAAIDLATLPRAIRGDLPLPAQGSLSGRIDWSAPAEGPDRFELALEGEHIAGRLPGAGAAAPPQAFALARPTLSGVLLAEAGGLRVRDGVLTDGGAPLRFEGRLGSGGGKAPLALALQTEEIELASLVERLPMPLPPAATELLERVERGHVDRLEIEIDTTVDGWSRIGRRGPLARPGDLRIELALSDLDVALGEDDRLEAGSATLRYDGDRLAVEGLRGRRHGKPFPRTSGEITGLAHLRGLDELRCRRPAEGGRIPGARELLAWMRSHRKEPKVPGWNELAVEADWISHPELLCGIEQLDASLRPYEAGGGLEITLRHGVWAGVALSGDARITDPTTRDAGDVTFRLALGSPFEPVALVPPSEPWARGRFDWNAFRLGGWRVLGARGGFELRQGTLRLSQVDLDLAPSGVIEGEVAIDLSRPTRLSYEASLRGADLDVTAFASAMRARDPGRLSGTLAGEATFQGELLRARSPLAKADGTLRLRARHGRVAREMPIVMALLVADSPFSPISDLEEIHYERAEAEAVLREGWFSTERIEIEGPSARMLATGRLAVEKPHAVEGVLGVLFFPALDSVIDYVPVLNRVILGENGNLIGAYYGLSGPWAEPTARLIPVKSLVSGPASFVLEDIPSFLWGGLKRIHSILIPAGPDRVGQTPVRVDS